MSIPVVIATNGLGLPVRAVDGGAPVMQVASNGRGLPIVLSDLGVPFVVLGGETPVEPDPVNPLVAAAPNALQIMDASTVTAANNDPIQTWADLTANARDMTQATLASRPLYQTAAGLHWLRFDGVNDHMRHPASIIRDAVQAGQTITIQMAVRATPGTDRRLYAEANTGVEFGQLYGLVQSGASTATGLAHFIRDNGATIRVPTAGVGVAFDGVARTISVTDTGSAIIDRINGLQVASTAYTPSTLTNNVSSIGALVRGSAASFFGGDVFAYVINVGGYSADIDAALRAKAGIA